VLHYTMLKTLAKDEHITYLSPFLSYEENEVL
jgi:hypothetical protein